MLVFYGLSLGPTQYFCEVRTTFNEHSIRGTPKYSPAYSQNFAFEVHKLFN